MPKELHFHWDPRKSLSNKSKHGISFEEASQIFGDKLAITILIQSMALMTKLVK